MASHIGIDLDNTIIQYDELFHTLALEQGLIPADTPKSKSKVRDLVREVEGGYPRWVALQGLVYGKEIHRAKIAPGFAEFLAEAKRRGHPVSIISHKTQYPGLGTRYDLHASARCFLQCQGFFDEGGQFGLQPEELMFRPTREAKLGEAAKRGCEHFIDDLIEVLTEDCFPAGAEKILISHGAGEAREVPGGIVQFRSWAEIHQHFFSA